ncbi:hypothetical protein Y032_0516g2801 [Ancylostoma ceylanicum]|nr:hypothetical protein Y032_0516g2801 [Ancylostoma ceylanicum]
MVIRFATSVMNNPCEHASGTSRAKLEKINKINKSINMSNKMGVRSEISVMDYHSGHISIWIGPKLRKPIKSTDKSILGSISSCEE